MYCKYRSSLQGSNMKKIKATEASSMYLSESVLYKALYKAISSQTSDIIYLLDKNCSIIDCNHNFLKLAGIDSIDEKNVGSLYKYMKESGFWTEKQVQMMKTKDIEVIVSGQSTIEIAEPPALDKQEQVHHYIASRIPILDDNQLVIALIVILKEVTERKIMEEQFEKIKHELEQFNARNDQTVKIINHVKPHQITSIPTESNEPLRVLVVEDNPVAQKAAQSILMQVDCVVDIIKTESELLNIFEPGKYAMVFMDIGLEETSGYILAKQIRNKEKNTDYHVPIIALTGYKAELLTADCDYYKMEGAITKPLTLEQARQLIQRYIHKIDVSVKGLNLSEPLNFSSKPN